MIDELQRAFALAAQQSEQEQAVIAARINEMIALEGQVQRLPSSPTLDALYGALADTPIPAIEHDPLPESRDEL
jgi:hypothetical protein